MNETGFGTLRNPSRCSVLSHSLNRVYLIRATPLPKFLAPLGTPDILKPLSEIAGDCLKMNILYIKTNREVVSR